MVPQLERRQLLATAALALAGTAAGCTQAQSASDANESPAAEATESPTDTPTTTPTETATETVPDFDGWMEGVENYDHSLADRTDTDEVVVTVGAQGNEGAFAFAPPAIQVEPGTTVRWKWTGNGGSHDVVAEGGGFESDDLYADLGVHFEHTFETQGVHRYYCTPHRALGMKGVVVVGDDYPTQPASAVETATEPSDADEETPTETPEPTGPYGGYLDGVDDFDGTAADRTDTDEVVVTVGSQANGGAFGFTPPAIEVTPGTTVRWKWTGNGGAHNVVAEDGAFDSGDVRAEAGLQFEHTFEATGTHRYYCAPHEALGMKGVVEVVEG